MNAVLLVVAVALAGQAQTRTRTRTNEPPPFPKSKQEQIIHEQSVEIYSLRQQVAALEERVARLEEAILNPKRREEAVNDIKAEKAIEEGRLMVGMTVEQANRALKSEGRVVGESEGRQEYLWWVQSDRPAAGGRAMRETYTSHSYLAWVEDGKIVSYDRMRGRVER
jgi:hypothetical protein